MIKRRSLQKIQDFYEEMGYKGDKLRKVLEKDKEWVNLVKERRGRASKKIKLTKVEQKRYVISTSEDYEIMRKIKQIEKLKLSNDERFFISLLKTQLEDDWRKPLIKGLDQLLKKYKWGT